MRGLNATTARSDRMRGWGLLITALTASLALVATTTPVAPPTDGHTPIFQETRWEDASALSGINSKDYPGSMVTVAQKATGADFFWNEGYIGSGVDVALIDTGVVPVDGLTYPGKLLHGPDLSFESQSPDHTRLDTYGHGTHMAGIIAGRDDAAGDVLTSKDSGFLGMAPGARLLSLKVGDYQGSVDVSQVIAAIDWVIQHKRDNGMNVRVLNLSFGTDSKQDYRIDPLAYVVERAWKSGIVVVAAAGNDGPGSVLRDPAISPYVIAVGASESNITAKTTDDIIAGFSSCGTPTRHVDVAAPGKSILSLRNPGSYADTEHPEARVNERFFLGSGTSQAAAVVSGAAALIIDQRPDITPDQVKKLLMVTADPLKDESTLCQGAGVIDLKEALSTITPSVKTSAQTYRSSMGSGLLEAARGSNHVQHDGVVLVGEQDIMGSPWHGWCNLSLDLAANCTSTFWDGGDWNGATWSGTTWSGTTWSGTTWSGTTWSGTTWSDIDWSGTTWSGTTWSGTTWSGTTWSGTTWSGAGWLGSEWG